MTDVPAEKGRPAGEHLVVPSLTALACPTPRQLTEILPGLSELDRLDAFYVKPGRERVKRAEVYAKRHKTQVRVLGAVWGRWGSSYASSALPARPTADHRSVPGAGTAESPPQYGPPDSHDGGGAGDRYGGGHSHPATWQAAFRLVLDQGWHITTQWQATTPGGDFSGTHNSPGTQEHPGRGHRGLYPANQPRQGRAS